MGRPIQVGDKAVALSALASLLREVDGVPLAKDDVDTISEQMIAAASRVKFQPSTRQLVLTFDLAFSVTDVPTTSQ